jgi:hypothetical protein
LFAACNVCQNHKLLFEDQCINNFECHSVLTKYDKRAHGGACEPPFVCDAGLKVGGGNEGRKCECLSSDCLQCSWSANGHSCVICRKSKYLLDGACVTLTACLEQGDHVPVRGSGPVTTQGGVCLKL